MEGAWEILAVAVSTYGLRVVGALVVLIFLAKPLICPHIVHHRDELARD